MKKQNSQFFNYFFIAVLLICSAIFAQTESNAVEAEMLKIHQDYLENPSKEESIPQSELLKEIQKPENQNLLEMLKNGEETEEGVNFDDLKDLEEFGKKTTEDGEDVKDGEDSEEGEDIAEEEDDEDKLKLIADYEQLGLINKRKYYESVKEYFGYNIFLTKYKPVDLALPANPNYIIGPGDAFLLTMWGDTELRVELKVNKEGTVHIPKVGIVSVHGSTISDFLKRVKKLLAKHYATIDPPNGKPTTFFDFYFAKIRSLNIYVNGEVVTPGVFAVPQGSTVLSCLILANGITAKGTMREIKIIRGGRVVHEIDMYNFLSTGKGLDDFTLRESDNIFVGPRVSTISLKGEILRPLKYELKSDESLKDLIKFAGGLLPTSSIDRIKIERIIPFNERVNVAVVTKVLDRPFTKVNENNELEILPVKLENFDKVKVYSLPRLITDYLAVDGAIYRPGRYQYNENMTIKDLIDKAGGVLAVAFLDKAELTRTYPDLTSEHFRINLLTDQDFVLNSRDSLKVYSKAKLKSKNFVIVNGFIKNPGFKVLSDSTRISDLILSKGGIEDKYRKDRTYLLRGELVRFNEDGLTTRIIHVDLNKVLEGDKSEDLILQDGDRLNIYDIGVVYEEPQVSISGFVKSQNSYMMSEKMTVEDLILKARGFTEGAYKEKAIVFRRSTDITKKDSISMVYHIDIDPDFLNKDNYKKSTFYLKKNDHVVIRKDPYYQQLRVVSLDGEVKFPGVYTLIKRNETLSELVKRAGGLNEEAFIEGLRFERDSARIVSDFNKVLEGNEKYDIVLKNGDKIDIPKHTGTVRVEGFVYTPGSLKYRKDWDVSDYIEAAGGLMEDLDLRPGDPVVYYPGGNARVDNGWFFSPSVQEGSLIYIPSIEKDPITDWKGEVRNWVGILTSALTVIVLVDALNN